MILLYALPSDFDVCNMSQHWQDMELSSNYRMIYVI